MDDCTSPNSERPLPELVSLMLEHLRNLRLAGPPTLQAEHYAKIWRSLSTAGNNIIETIEGLRHDGHWRWETGDAASIELFGRNCVPKAKKFLHDMMRELYSLGITWHVNPAGASIETQRFDPERVPRLVEPGATGGDVKVEDVKKEEDVTTADIVKSEDVKKEDVKKEVVKAEVAKNGAVKEEVIKPEDVKKEVIKPEDVKKEVIKTEPVEPSPQDHVLTSIEPHTTTSSFKTPTAPRPADYKPPPRGPSFSPISPPPPPQTITETTSNSINDPTTAPFHPPLQYPNDQDFQSYLSTINFVDDDYDDAHSMFEVPTPIDVQKEISPPPSQLASQAPGPATAARKELQEYMTSVKSVLVNIKSLVYLMQPVSDVEVIEG